MTQPHLEAIPSECEIKVVLKVVRPHSTMVYRPELDVETPLGMLKEELEDALAVPRARQQWKVKGAELDDGTILANVLNKGEAEVIVNILPAPQGE